MAWARLDDRANNNAKLLALSDGGHRMWTCGLVYCQDNLTDGFIAESAIRTFGVRASVAKVIEELCAVLVPGKKPLWHRVAGGYQVNDYADFNDPAKTVQKKRAQTRERVQRFRSRVDAQSNALQPALQDALVTANTERSERVSNGAPYPCTSTERTNEYSAGCAVASRTPVENRLTPNRWTIALAIAHRVIEDDPRRPENWSENLKARMLNQGIDANDKGPKGTKAKFFERVLAACIEQRKFRKGDGGVFEHRWRRRARDERRAS